MERTEEEEEDRTALQMERAMDDETLNCHRERERENHCRAARVRGREKQRDTLGGMACKAQSRARPHRT